MNFGTNVRKYRKKANLTQAELALAASVMVLLLLLYFLINRLKVNITTHELKNRLTAMKVNRIRLKVVFLYRKILIILEKKSLLIILIPNCGQVLTHI